MQAAVSLVAPKPIMCRSPNASTDPQVTSCKYTASHLTAALDVCQQHGCTSSPSRSLSSTLLPYNNPVKSFRFWFPSCSLALFSLSPTTCPTMPELTAATLLAACSAWTHGLTTWHLPHYLPNHARTHHVRRMDSWTNHLAPTLQYYAYDFNSFCICTTKNYSK